MVEVGRFVDGLKAAGAGFFTGMPDSLLKSFCAYVTDNCDENHAIREGELDRGINVQKLHNIQIGRGRPELMYDLDVAAVLGSVTMATPRPSRMGRNDATETFPRRNDRLGELRHHGIEKREVGVPARAEDRAVRG